MDNDHNAKTNDEKVVTPNAWLVKLGQDAFLNEFSVTLHLESNLVRGVYEKDALLIVDTIGMQLEIIAIARVYRKRYEKDKTILYFDGFIPLESNNTLEELGISIARSNVSIIRINWPVFINCLSHTVGLDNFELFPTIRGENLKEQSYIRELLQQAVIDDLLGPANGPEEEIVGMSVRDRYLVGRLAPMNCSFDEGASAIASKAELNGASGRNDYEEPNVERGPSTNQSLAPSSIGFTFCVDGSAKSLQLQANWGRYIRIDSDEVEKIGKPLKAWKRIPSGGLKQINLNQRIIEPFEVDSNCPEVIIQGTVSLPLENGDKLVTLFMVNTQKLPEQNQDQSWVFQPELIVHDTEDKSIFRKRPVLVNEGFDDEREALEMIYRDYVEFAVGHGISVKVKTDRQNNDQALEIRTSVVPSYEVPQTETPGLDSLDRPAMREMVDRGYLDMERLANLDKDELISALFILTNDYSNWINEQRKRIGTDVMGFDPTATDAMHRCDLVLKRLNEGIHTLKENTNALEAFRFANRSMALQRIHSMYALKKRRGEEVSLDSLNITKNRSWRPFQLAFMLLSIPSLSNPKHEDRTKSLGAYADLLWFPTGGGKTEAYLGVAAFTMAIRRLQKNLGGYDSERGLSVIMRYTLRLLTIQQFQRATALICSMEVLRRENIKTWGLEPFTLGLWVGKRLTPNTTEESHTAVSKDRDSKQWSGSTPAQLTSCPWCGSEILAGRDIVVDKDIGRTHIYCGDKYGSCEFSRAKGTIYKGIPVLVVDEEIYRRPPSMLIATVDKFALMAWKGETRTLFGQVSQECDRHGLIWPDGECTGNHRKKGIYSQTTARKVKSIRPPDLIIQDEFHLISGPLGTMVGLYETAVDELSTWTLDGQRIKPKVIASTATVRKAQDQINNVFLRQVNVFPPHGLDVEDNFFSVQRSISEKPGRRYMGICSPGSSRPAVLIRVYVAFLTAAQALFERFGSAADPYMTLVGYFNSLRELGGMRRLAEDDVQTRCFRVLMSKVTRPGLVQRSVRVVDELTSRVSNKDIPKKLDQLEVKFKESWEKGETRAIDIALATNMLSVGVDVNRLGLMVVNGQPKSTAEYIQATSRVGRSFPGLVCTVLTWSRPRDLSHYESFEHYHSTFYKHVEAQSVTPFAPRALDRGLTGTIVSLFRLGNDGLNPNVGAQQLDSVTHPEVEKVKMAIIDRSWKVKDRMAKENTENMFAERVDRWVKEAAKPGRKLGYEGKSRQGDVAALLKKAGTLAWDEFTVPMSMREVEPGVRLVIDDSKLADPPNWQMSEKERNGGGDQ